MKQRHLTRIGVSPYPQHASCSKATPPKPTQIVPCARNQFFKYSSLWGVVLIQTTIVSLSFDTEKEYIHNTSEIYVQKNFWTHVTYQNSRKYKKEIQIIKFTNQEKGLGPEKAVLLKCNQTFKEITPMFLKQFHIIEREGTLPNWFCEVNVILVPKPNRAKRRRKYSPISLNAKLCKILANSTLQAYHRLHDKFPSRDTKMFFIFYKSINISRMRDKNHTIIPIDGKETLTKIQHPFMVWTRYVEKTHTTLYCRLCT